MPLQFLSPSQPSRPAAQLPLRSAWFSAQSVETQQAVVLMQEYAFELRGQTLEDQVRLWLGSHRPTWIRDAVIEALHQGRYKAISVQQILALWQRRGEPVRHFTREFEQAIATPIGLQLVTQHPGFTALATGDRATAIEQIEAHAEARIEEQIEQAGAASSFTSSTVPTHRLRRSAAQAARVAFTAADSNGVLCGAHPPIQPFQPQLPFPSHLRLTR